MPGVTAGVYTGSLDAGTEVSSTYEGRHLTVLESELIHPYHADGFVDKGDPVILCDAGVPTTYGTAVGVAFNSATAATEYIAIDTEGIWNLTVYAENEAGNVAVEIGDPLFIRAGNLAGAADADGTGDAELSKMVDGAHQVPFGYALGSIVSGGSGVIAVKVHFDPADAMEKREYYTVTSGTYTYGRHHTSIFAGGASTGLEYFDQAVTGTQTGGIYGLGTWLEVDGSFVGIAGNLLVGFECAIYDAGGTLGGWVVCQQMQMILASDPTTRCNWFRMNMAAAGGTIDSLISFANPTSAGAVFNALETSTVAAHIPFCFIAGSAYDAAALWIRLYDGAT